MPLRASLAELFAKDRPDGVVLATPNQVHVDQALECIAAGVPTLVEKPVAHTLEAGMRLCAAAEAAGVPVLVGHHRRHSSIMAKAVEVIASGMLGKIVAVVGTALFYKPENEGYYDGASAWRREPGGGPILLNMIHEVGNLRSLCGEIVAVQAFTSNATRQFPVEDTAAIALRFASGALGTFMLSDTAASDRSWEHTSGEDPRYREGAHRQGRLLCRRRHVRLAGDSDDAPAALSDGGRPVVAQGAREERGRARRRRSAGAADRALRRRYSRQGRASRQRARRTAEPACRRRDRRGGEVGLRRAYVWAMMSRGQSWPSDEVSE